MELGCQEMSRSLFSSSVQPALIKLLNGFFAATGLETSITEGLHEVPCKLEETHECVVGLHILLYADPATEVQTCGLHRA